MNLFQIRLCLLSFSKHVNKAQQCERVTADLPWDVRCRVVLLTLPTAQLGLEPSTSVATNLH
jgi:hypothetical protein